MRTILRYLCFATAIGVFVLSFFALLLSSKQISKNRLELADMQDRVEAVKKYYREKGHLPNNDAFQALSDALPVRYMRSPYHFASSERDSEVAVSTQWPTNGWVISYWRGEWHEYYTSWNEYYTLTEQSTWWGFCGIVLFSPLIAGLLFVCCFTPVLKKRHA